MLPLWIIDLGSSATSKERLQNLLCSTGDSIKPFWHYYHVEETPISDGASYKALMNKLVDDGRDCYNAFVKSGYKVGNFQIIVIGAAHEQFSQKVFAPLAGLIRDNLSRIIFDHANLGVEITGILYIPSTINQLDNENERKNAAMLLEDVNILSERLGAKHFNRVIAYQDIQYKKTQFYHQLDSEQRAELLFQIITNLFFAGAESERLFDKIGKESGIFSLGAASIYYNSEHHRSYELKRLLDKLLVEFKDIENTDEGYAEKIVREVLEDDAINTDAISAHLLEGCSSVDIDLPKMDEEADPHPVWDLFRSDLFPSYYRKFLKYMPARLTRFMQSLSYILLSRFSGIIRNNRKTAVERFIPLLYSFYEKVFLDSAAQYATIAQMESVFKAAKEFLLRKRAEVVLTLMEIVPIPKYLRNDYEKCLTDEESNKPYNILENIKKNLKKEPVVLSLLVRCFLLGILLVFTIIPVVRVLSPNVVNLGEIATIEWLWIPVLFLLPLIIEFFIKLRRHFKRIRRLKFRLLAATLLAVNRRLSQLLMDEQGVFYDALIHECESQLERLARFRELLSVPEVKDKTDVIPVTMFNQPLLNGSFCGEKMLKDESAAEAEIPIKNESQRISKLEKLELLFLLKISFKQPETLQAANLSDKETPDEHAKGFVSALGNIFRPLLHINTAENIGLMLSILDKDVDLSPFIKMAGVNGMLFSVPSKNPPALRIMSAPTLFEKMDLMQDSKTADYALLTLWQKITQGIQSQLVCNCTLGPLPPLSFADKLSLYYAFYRQKDLAYTLAGVPIRISKEEMEKLDKQIIGG